MFRVPDNARVVSPPFPNGRDSFRAALNAARNAQETMMIFDAHPSRPASPVSANPSPFSGRAAFLSQNTASISSTTPPMDLLIEGERAPSFRTPVQEQEPASPQKKIISLIPLQSFSGSFDTVPEFSFLSLSRSALLASVPASWDEKGIAINNAEPEHGHWGASLQTRRDSLEPDLKKIKELIETAEESNTETDPDWEYPDNGVFPIEI